MNVQFKLRIKMKDKICNARGCMNRISGAMNKSGLCTKCSSKKWKSEHKEEMKAYSKKYLEDNKEKLEPATKIRLEKWRKDNPEHMKEYGSKYYDENKDFCKGLSKKHYEENKEDIAKRHLNYANTRYKLDEGFRIRKRLGGALSSIIRLYIKTGKVGNRMKEYVINWEGIIKQLSPIPKDRHLYHVDHIIPLFKFDLTDIEQVHLAFAPENHRWMLAKENQGRDRKGV